MAEATPPERLLGSPRSQDGGDHWFSISDLMAGLMMVFLFVSIALMRHAYCERDRIREIAVAYRETQVAIHDALQQEFAENLVSWDATVSPDLSVEFHSPEVLFKAGEAVLQPRFLEILGGFFPRYLGVLETFKEEIDEIRIEGHTSSEWFGTTGNDAYFNNMQLSQGRTRSVLEHVHSLPALSASREWIKAKIAAVGFSSAHAIRDPNTGAEIASASRRVTVRVVTNAETKIRKILEEQGTCDAN